MDAVAQKGSDAMQGKFMRGRTGLTTSLNRASAQLRLTKIRLGTERFALTLSSMPNGREARHIVVNVIKYDCWIGGPVFKLSYAAHNPQFYQRPVLDGRAGGTRRSYWQDHRHHRGQCWVGLRSGKALRLNEPEEISPWMPEPREGSGCGAG